MFKDLIPTPTAGDAMTQYIKNISQFGFILAILLGMGAVAGEKERGIVPMIISKPLPRWAFISSKFAAQFLMYLGGFVLAGLGAYYYTLILFGGLDPGGFTLLNLLMLLWLLTFVALSLLGSTLGSSTVAAGGIGLGLSVVLLLAGNLPLYGTLLPGGLLGWATLAGQAAAGIQSAAQAAGPFDPENVALGGSAAAAIVLVVFTLILSIGIFEQQEL
jgi:ABC-2 type transport system permease protein